MTAIDGNRGYSPLEPLTQTASSAPTSTQSRAAGTAAITDQASFSSAGAQIAAGEDTSDVRLEKVSALQKAIAAGAYNVPSAAVADKLLDSLQR